MSSQSGPRSETQSGRSSGYVPPRRPLGLPAVVAVWVGVALYGFYAAYGLYGPLDYPSAAFDFGSNNQLLTQDTSLRMFLVVLSLVQLLFAASILRGGSWSFPAGLALSLTVFGVYADLYWLYSSAPARWGLKTPMLTESVLVGLGFVFLVWGYFTRPHVKHYLTRWV